MFLWMNTLEQGHLGEVSALAWLVSLGYQCAIPYGPSPDWDLAAEIGGHLVRIQVKTSRSIQKNRWHVSICTRGGNQSWSGVVKRMHRSRCDYLFVLVGDGRRWFIPSDRVEGTTGICLGGPKYSEFEVERGRPFIPQGAS
ncbi:MAG: endonuclease, partial [Thermoleophilaceae bacterium]|nr:endonuclease [Thermoleophilaceae bacterium]